MPRLPSRGALSLTRSPPITMSPEVMSSSPTTIRSNVDFPQPEGPTRIMNSPSLTSMLTSFTAGKPSPYCLTMFFISMAAMRVSPLHCAGGDPGDDTALKEQHAHDHWDGHHHRSGRQLGVRRVERVRPDEVRQLGRHGPRDR